MYHNDGMQYIRQAMIDDLIKKGISSQSVLYAMSLVPRHLFMSEALRYSAYKDCTLPIGFGQTISKPSVIALMAEALELHGNERVLEVGTGSGYLSAILSMMANSVVSIERIRELSIRAKEMIKAMKISNVSILHTDDFMKLEGTFDTVIVSAGADKFPFELFSKVVENGSIVIPISNNAGHTIKKYTKRTDGLIVEEDIGAATFVPLITGIGA